MDTFVVNWAQGGDLAAGDTTVDTGGEFAS
jgi:hypothetical protein